MTSDYRDGIDRGWQDQSRRANPDDAANDALPPRRPLRVAEPVDEPQAALVATCTCGRRIWRLALDSARWRHDNWGITCPPPGPAFDHLVKGNQP